MDKRKHLEDPAAKFWTFVGSAVVACILLFAAYLAAVEGGVK